MIEFNELSPVLMDRFIKEGKLPNFKRFYDEAYVYVSDAEEEPPRLNPWVQWVTVHTGLPFSKHGVFYLGEGHKLKEKCIWDYVSERNSHVLVCGSMNLRYDLPINGTVVPDPWTNDTTPYPEELGTYYRFVQHQVQEHTNLRASISPIDYLRFLLFMVTHGLSWSTIFFIARELARERFSNYRWRRTVILDRFQWDLFRWYFKKLKPQFSTFFLNSTAHFQHKYWRNMEPDLFKLPPAPEEQSECEKAILFGYQEMDQLIGRFMKLVGANGTLILATALSQKPCMVYDEEGGKCFYRPYNFEHLLDFAGVTQAHSVSPVMSEEFHIRFDDIEDMSVAAERLRSLRLNERPVLLVEERKDGIYSGCCVHDQVSRDAVLSIIGSEKVTEFLKLFYQGEGIKSGMHDPDGILWIRRPDRKHLVQDRKVSLCAVAPTVLNILGIPCPHSMTGESLFDGTDGPSDAKQFQGISEHFLAGRN